MAGRANSRRAVAIVALVLGATSLQGCGGGIEGVELNGKIFDALGVSGDAFGKKPEPRTEARAPLVLPPDTQRLPDPNAAAPIATGAVDQNWPKDPVQQKQAQAEAKKKAQEEYCKNGNWKQKAVKDDIGADKGPEGSCNGSIFSAIGEALGGKSQ